MDQETPSLSIIIVNYNGKRFFENCINSIKKNMTMLYEIIVVDNASTDGSAEYIKKNYPDIKLIKSEENLGFSKGNNLGFIYAKGEYLLFLNNDTILLNNIDPAIMLFKKHPNIGVLGARMVDPDMKYRYSCGYFPSPLRLFFISSMFKKNSCFRNGNFASKLIEFYPVDWVEGSFFLTKKDIWKKTGGLDEKFFMYGEDVDFCRRVKNFKHLVVYYPWISYVHFGGYDSSRMGLLIKGFQRFHKKHSGMLVQVAVSFILTMGMVTRTLFNLMLSIGGNQIYRTKASQYWNVLTRKA